MPTNPETARDEMFAMLAEAREDFPIADVKGRWEGKETAKETENVDRELVGDFWFRASTEIVASRQSAFTNDEVSQAVYTTRGLLFVQVFAPRSVEDSWRKGDLLATFIRDIYRNAETASGVTFTRPVAKNLKPDGSFWRWNVVIEFEFMELH